ncbi:MAG: PilT/PilU family type 4a pilus ATPase [Xanthomonadales bacterium]|nr:PilT/PilU family type 4a pilus ATPase [Xanthomonadales bacterium]
MARIDAFLKLALAQGCSDIHLAVGVPPMLRMRGDLMPIKFRELGENELSGYFDEIMTENQRSHYMSGEDLDFSYVTDEGVRFRANLFRKATGPGAVFRYIPNDIPNLEKLNLPPVIRSLTDLHQGLILVTGATGTGKSTTLASMIDHLNQTRPLNILSLEDPIEFVHPSKRSQVIQREVGTHVNSFADGLRAALREDPDVILVGEMRDAETISMAMTAAETGHLVLGTLHTTGAVKSIDRILDALPAEDREQGKAFLANSLQAVVSQVLCKTPDRKGRRAVLEIMVMTRAIAKLIGQDQTHLIPSQVQTGKHLGMQLMDMALMEMLKAQEINADDAYLYASDKNQFERFVTDKSLLPNASLSEQT